METIANETEDRPPPGVDNPYRLVEIRCAPRYTGEERMLEIPVVWLPIAEQLIVAGRDRAFHSSARGKEGKPLLRAAWGAIRRIWREEAAPAGMSQVVAAKLVGISRAQFHTIINTGEEG